MIDDTFQYNYIKYRYTVHWMSTRSNSLPCLYVQICSWITENNLEEGNDYAWAKHSIMVYNEEFPIAFYLNNYTDRISFKLRFNI